MTNGTKTSLRWSLDAEGIGWITFDPADHRPPLVGSAVITGIDEAIGALGAARALVLSSAVPSAFLAGADLSEVLSVPDAPGAVARAREAQRVLRRLETLPVPTFAAIRGACLGAGVEIALACAYRLASDGAETRLEFPETRYGMVPGLGGTVRLPRLVGLEAALELIVPARSVSAEEAREIGLVDTVLPANEFMEAVRSTVHERLDHGRIRTGARRRITRRLMEDTAPGRRLVAARVARRLLSHDPTPGGRSALDLILEGVALPLDRAFERGAEVAGALVASEAAKGLTHAARSIAIASRQPTADALDRVGVLEAGRGSAEWAYLLITSGAMVRLRDPDRARLSRTTDLVLRRLASDVGEGRRTEVEADRAHAALQRSPGFGGFGTLDAVVFGGSSEGGLLQNLGEVEDHTAAGCLLVCSSTGVRTADLQRTSARPESVIRCILMPSPHSFPVLEIVPGPATSSLSIARAVGLARRMGLIPLQAADSPGGAVARLLGVYLSEALRLRAEGVETATIDRAMEDFGFAAGPLKRIREMGPDRAMDLLRDLSERHGDRFSPPEGEPPPAGRISPDEPVRTRVLLALLNEASLLLEERVLGTAETVDAATILGLGFPRARGGLLRYADSVGVQRLEDSLAELSGRLGERFTPAPLLRHLAATGGAFTGQP